MAEYTVHNVVRREELDTIVEFSFNGRFYPYRPYSVIATPVQGYTAEDQSRALAATKERAWTEYQATREHRTWICVRDRDGSIVGGCQYLRLKESPFPNGCPKVDFYWMPDGEQKEFCQEILQQVLTPRSMWMQREHGAIGAMVVSPRHRLRGVGGLMTQHVNEQLDFEQLEGFVEASEEGHFCYRKYGYRTVMKLDFFAPDDKGDMWQKLLHELKSDPVYIMWRPVKGRPDPQGRTRPWQLGSQIPI